MKLIAPYSFLLLWLLSACPAISQPNRDAGYRDCGLHNLAACQDSNQLFFGLGKKPLQFAKKSEFSNAISRFLQVAPKLYLGETAFPVSNTAEESLVGPGDHRDHLPGGEWFFDGFTPHDAPDKGAVLFRFDGEIIAIAILDTTTDIPSSRSVQDSGRYTLRIYCHESKPRPDLLKVFQQWGQSALNPNSPYPGILPNNALVASRIYTRIGNHWVSESLP